MVETIEALNNTSGTRTFFYVVAFIIALEIVVDGITAIVKHSRKPYEEKKN